MATTPDPATAGGVQSVNRALDVLEAVAAAGGPVSVVDLAARVGLPAPTTHRIVRTLVTRGYLRQLSSRAYTLGFRLVPLGESARAILGAGAQDTLAGLVAALGETANLAVLVGDQAEYVAQAPASYSMRMFTEVGRRVDLHCTGVGKALLAQLSDEHVDGLVTRTGLPFQTPHTITSPTRLGLELQRIRTQGYALDEQEQELGVRCVAVALPGDGESPMAVSISGPLTRVTDDVVQRAVPLLHAAAAALRSGVATTRTAG